MSVKRIILAFLLSALLTVVFTFLLYNAVQMERAVIYFVSFCSFFTVTVIIKQKIRPKWVLALIVLLPTIIIDASVFITFPGLIPLRFPFATSFPILGVLGGFLYLNKPKFYSLPLVLAVVAFSFASWKYIIPQLEYYGWDHNSYTLSNPDFSKGDRFLNENGDTITLSNTPKTGCILYENYYVGCSACEAKYAALKNLRDSLANSVLEIKMICSTVTKFETFVAHAKKHQYPGIRFLFDFGVAMQPDGKSIELFPLELLTYKGKTIATYEGFGYSYGKTYTDDHIKLINSLQK
ncbi:MAG: hypothetical protein ABIX01_06805 [Chitinophagaceae bacterium]